MKRLIICTAILFSATAQAKQCPQIEVEAIPQWMKNATIIVELKSGVRYRYEPKYWKLVQRDPAQLKPPSQMLAAQKPSAQASVPMDCPVCPSCPAQVQAPEAPVAPVQVVKTNTVYAEASKNRFTLLGGYGPTGLTKSDNQDAFEVQREFGAILGAQYSRAIGSFSLTGGFLSNQTGLVGAGYEF